MLDVLDARAKYPLYENEPRRVGISPEHGDPFFLRVAHIAALLTDSRELQAGRKFDIDEWTDRYEETLAIYLEGRTGEAHGGVIIGTRTS
jgi:hypothetical protein